jgi:hypothetical protein
MRGTEPDLEVSNPTVSVLENERGRVPDGSEVTTLSLWDQKGTRRLGTQAVIQKC